MPQVVLLLKMPCDRTSWIGTEVGNPLRLPNHEQDPQRLNALMSQVLRAAQSCSMNRAIYSPAQRNRQLARPTPQTEAPIAPRQGDPGSRVTLACNMESSPQWWFLWFPVVRRERCQSGISSGLAKHKSGVLLRPLDYSISHTINSHFPPYLAKLLMLTR